MKQIINNHVHGSQLVTITNNTYSVDMKKMFEFSNGATKLRNNSEKSLIYQKYFFGYI